MVEIVGDLWREVGRADLILVTTNGSVRMDGGLVMGRGAARQAAERYPGLEFDLGRKTLLHPTARLLFSDVVDRGTKIGGFRVKRAWKQKADLWLIRESVGALKVLCESSMGYKRIAMNFPGIGNGGLTRDEVLPLIRDLPEIVHVYRLREVGHAQR